MAENDPVASSLRMKLTGNVAPEPSLRNEGLDALGIYTEGQDYTSTNHDKSAWELYESGTCLEDATNPDEGTGQGARLKKPKGNKSIGAETSLVPIGLSSLEWTRWVYLLVQEGYTTL